jgi:dTDP-4-amino-4,6-dideoxygalactose transaminase
MKAGKWKYSIDLPGYKYNMTDLAASIGLVQLKRFESMKQIRKKLYARYLTNLKSDSRLILPPFESGDKENCYHLLPVRIRNADEALRDRIIDAISAEAISVNVHFIPLPLHPAYSERGYKMSDYPNAYAMYCNEITLPLYSTLSEENVDRVCKTLQNVLDRLMTGHGE